MENRHFVSTKAGLCYYSDFVFEKNLYIVSDNKRLERRDRRCALMSLKEKACSRVFLLCIPDKNKKCINKECILAPFKKCVDKGIESETYEISKYVLDNIDDIIVSLIQDGCIRKDKLICNVANQL